MWWRIFIPSWRFFNTLGHGPELFVKTPSGWQKTFVKSPTHWFALFFNPKQNYRHACNNLLERFVIELSEGHNPNDLVSYSLIRHLVNYSEFKVVAKDETVFHYESVGHQ